MPIRTSGGVITKAELTDDGFLQVFSSFLMAGELEYERGGKRVRDLLPWEFVSDSTCLHTATGKPCTDGHPPIKDNWMKSEHWATYGKGMTGNIIYLQEPFAVISCLIGDPKLVADIQAGHVQQVSSCRRYQALRDSKTGQRIQGKWTGNHLAFIDKRSGRVGRSPGAWVLTNGNLPKIDESGHISVDSVPGVTYDIPDYSTFVLTSQVGSTMIYSPPVNEAKTNPSRIILSMESIVVDDIQDDPSEEPMELTAESLKAITDGVATSIAAPMQQMTDTIVNALKPPVAADSAVVYTAEEVDAERKAANALGLKKGRLLGLASNYPVKNSKITADSTIKDICVEIIEGLGAQVSADTYTEDDLPGVVEGLVLARVASNATAPEPKPTYTGAKVPEDKAADSSDPPAKPEPTPAMARNMAAMKAAHNRK